MGSGEDVESLSEDFLKKVKSLKAKKLSDLAHLSPFSDVVVIQRRFMPKTGRLAGSLSSVFTLSSEFFLNTGVGARINYYFLEKHGLELSGYYVFTFDRGVTKDLKNIAVNVSERLPIARSFVGLTYKWVPVYGKISLYNRKIVAFDTFFNIGGGVSGIRRKSQAQTVWEPTAIFGGGQIFAITRDLGFRWDLRWHGTVETKQPELNYLNDILFSLSLIYYYPSAGSR